MNFTKFQKAYSVICLVGVANDTEVGISLPPLQLYTNLGKNSLEAWLMRRISVRYFI